MTRKYKPKTTEARYRRPKAPWQPTPEERQRIETMAGMGMTLREIGMVLKKNRDTIALRCPDEIAQGALKANMTVVGNLFKQTAANVRAAEFWLINRDPSRWKMRSYLEGGFTVTHTERPDLSGLSREELAILRQAAAVLRGAQAKQIDGESRRLEQPAEQGEDAA